uniref:Plant bHLH transcription factor ACT-like domain-containing protein n=1 Tax=Aegilops tauschii TaxID=37682 RepID=N1QPG2_AEGTA
MAINGLMVRIADEWNVWPFAWQMRQVECKEEDTRVEIYCAAKPGLLLSMVSTLDTLSLDIQQCIVDCFNDFAIHASCSEDCRF